MRVFTQSYYSNGRLPARGMSTKKWAINDSYKNKCIDREPVLRVYERASQVYGTASMMEKWISAICSVGKWDTLDKTGYMESFVKYFDGSFYASCSCHSLNCFIAFFKTNSLNSTHACAFYFENRFGNILLCIIP